MKNRISFIATLLPIILCVSGNVFSSGWADRVSISGFSSATFNMTDSSEPFNGKKNIGHDKQGSFSDTRVGLIVNSKINKRLRFATQMLGSKKDDYALHIDWAFANLKLTNDVTFRMGKIKFPVGLINEYVDVGYAMPWIIAPQVIYSGLGPPNGPQMTRAGYTGASLLASGDFDDWSVSADLFGGEIDLEGAKVRKLTGAAVSADWDDTVTLKASIYEGTMRGTANLAMEGAKHRGTMVGFKADWNNIIAYGEHAIIKMGDLDVMKATSWYTTLGYQMGKILPHVTYQSFMQGKDSAQEDEQTIIALGLRWNWMPGVALKAEISQIKTDKGFGLFPQKSNPDNTVNMIGFSLDTIF